MTVLQQKPVTITHGGEQTNKKQKHNNNNNYYYVNHCHGCTLLGEKPDWVYWWFVLN